MITDLLALYQTQQLLLSHKATQLPVRLLVADAEVDHKRITDTLPPLPQYLNWGSPLRFDAITGVSNTLDLGVSDVAISAVMLADTAFCRSEARLALVGSCIANGIRLWQEVSGADLNSAGWRIVGPDFLFPAPSHQQIIELIPNYEGKVVCITGAGGSVGSALVHALCSLKPKRLVIIDVAETPLMQVRWYAESNGIKVSAYPISVTDIDSLESIFSTESIDYVIHAAALKHLILAQEQPLAALNANVLGTSIMANVAGRHNTKGFCLVSTDKAARPDSVLGATKLLAEKLLVGVAANYKNTVFSLIRFGNLIDSSGSVLPIFGRQIANGTALQVRQIDTTRYFTGLSAAAFGVLQVTAFNPNVEKIGLGVNRYILQPGPSELVYNLALVAQLMSGITFATATNNIEIQPLQGGEKNHEILFDSASETISDIALSDLVYRLEAKKMVSNSVFDNQSYATLVATLKKLDSNDLFYTKNVWKCFNPYITVSERTKEITNNKVGNKLAQLLTP